LLPGRWKRGTKVVETHLEDANADGMKLAITTPFPVNQIMDLVIDLPTGPVAMLAVSREHHGGGLGVMIFAMSDADRTRWNTWYRTMVAAPPA
jgi:hypothetical protein